MSITVSNCKEICNSPLNNSKSKQLYSFPKTKKSSLGKKPDCEVFYDLPSVASTRVAGIGYGTKYDFTKAHGDSPAPNVYQIRSSFDSENKKKGISFGMSRQAMAITGGMLVGDKNSPGPGAYDVRGINKSTIAFTFRAKTNLDAATSTKFVPGPGNYAPPQALTKDGKYFVSNYKNSGATTIAPASFRRFKDDNQNSKEVPGPGQYDLKAATINPKGSYFVSKFRSSLARSFGHSLRQSKSTTSHEIPGPGSYKLPSEFGYYESATARKSNSSSVDNLGTVPKGDKEAGKEKEAAKEN